MYRLWLHIEEFDSGGEPVREALEPVELADVDELTDVEALLDRLLALGGEASDHLREPGVKTEVAGET